MQIELTRKQIERDIENFRTRIEAAKAKLKSLPTGYLPYPECKKREEKRKQFQSEIVHVENLISIAKESFAHCEF